MARTAAAPASTTRPQDVTGLGLLIAIAAIGAAILGTFVGRPATSMAPPFAGSSSLGGEATPPPPTSSGAVPVRGVPGRLPAGAIGEKDGALPNGVTVFDDRYPGVDNLERDLLGALRDAAKAAESDGIEIVVNSGWRSSAYQDQLLRDAVATYGSKAEAARWVATAATSPHVAGVAVDLGPVAATAWLSRHGAAYGLCQIYRNEPWHYELRPRAIGDRCPRMYADPTEDPRLED